ncbi:MAG: ATP-binding protein [Proteobacteria bacterium]|nr:ATP-binding protein [Pseudomonadota bacterium]
MDLTLQRGGGRGFSIHVAPFGDELGAAVLSFHAQGTARNMERQLSHRSAARSVSAMAAMLAHEVKNPLSGIRGAAQLLERVVKGADQELARLICGETDRINALVDRMGGFVADGPLDRSAVNIHEVLERVQRSAEAGFARHVKFFNDYDPSLPPVVGNRDQLIQIFLNLVKNAAEAAPRRNGEITLKTGFRQGVRLAVAGREGRVHLPLMISVSDNGSGMSDEIARHLFDPFITTKSGGAGLGLALVAKLIDDHGGIIEFDTNPSGTDFRVFLPVYTEMETEEGLH